MQDGPLGLRFSDYNSAFPVGVTSGATWSRHLWRDRGAAMGAEARDKGVDVLLGPASGPLGRLSKGGRIAEAFGADPYLQGLALSNTVTGIQSNGVVACAKHYIANEQGMMVHRYCRVGARPLILLYRTLPPGRRVRRPRLRHC